MNIQPQQMWHRSAGEYFVMLREDFVTLLAVYLSCSTSGLEKTAARYKNYCNEGLSRSPVHCGTQ